MRIFNLRFCIPNVLASFLPSLVFIKSFVRKLLGKISLLKHRWLNLILPCCYFISALSVLPYLMCLFNVISVITTSSNHTRLVDFNAPLLESPFALMKACCQLAETLVSFLLLQQSSEDFYYYLSCWLVLQHVNVGNVYFASMRQKQHYWSILGQFLAEHHNGKFR